MSIELAKAYIERVKTDQEFAQKVAVCKDKKARMALVKAEGFDFTVEEVKSVVGAMSDGELEAMRGVGEGSGAAKCCWIGWETTNL